METIRFTLDDGTISDEVFIIAQTTISGAHYFLVSDKNDEDNCYLLKDESESETSEACLVEVEKKEEWESVAKVFRELLDEDINLEI